MKTTTQSALSACKPGLHGMATRIVNAEERFVDFVINSTACDHAAATRVLGYYKKHKLVKFSVVGGDFSVKHGALLDTSTLAHCLTLVG